MFDNKNNIYNKSNTAKTIKQYRYDDDDDQEEDDDDDNNLQNKIAKMCMYHIITIIPVKK